MQTLCSCMVTSRVLQLPVYACRLLSVVDFAEWAAESNAVVFISVAGSIVRNGQLQGLLTSARVAYTGSQTIETQICANKVLYIARHASHVCLALTSSGQNMTNEKRMQRSALYACSCVCCTVLACGCKGIQHGMCSACACC